LSGLATVNIGTGVTAIDANAFNGCAALTSVTFIGVGDAENPSKVTSIKDGAFKGTGITEIELPAGVSIGKNAFDGSKLTSIDLTNASSIDESAFANCVALTDADLGDLTTIPASAFAKSGLTSIVLTNVATINGNAFEGTALVTVTVPKASIAANSFKDCKALTTVIIGEDVTTITAGAFTGSTALATVTLNGPTPSGALTGFDDLTGLTTVNLGGATFGATVSGTSFAAANGLTAINVTTGNTLYANNTPNDGVLYNLAKGELIKYPQGKTPTAYTIPASVTSIGESAFSNFRFATISIPSTVESIGDTAFEGSLLTSLVLNGSLFSIGDDALPVGCTELTIKAELGDVPNTTAFDGTFPTISKLIVDTGYTGEISVEPFKTGSDCNILELTLNAIPTDGLDDFDTITKLNLGPAISTSDMSGFNWADTIETITVAEGNDDFSAPGNGGALYNGAGTTLIKYLPANDAEEFIVSSAITISAGAFTSCDHLVTLILNAAATITSGAFVTCAKLENLEINAVQTSYNTLPDTLKKVTIGVGGVNLGTDVFSAVTTLVLDAAPGTIAADAFGTSVLKNLEVSVGLSGKFLVASVDNIKITGTGTIAASVFEDLTAATLAVDIASTVIWANDSFKTDPDPAAKSLKEVYTTPGNYIFAANTGWSKV
jgi:hypothetical protein